MKLRQSLSWALPKRSNVPRVYPRRSFSRVIRDRFILCCFFTGLGLLLAVTLKAGEGTKWKFMVYGDHRGSSTQINTAILSELARETTNQRPAFVLDVGDLVYTGDLAAFQEWTNIMAPVYEAGIKIYPVMGTHDTNDVDAFLQVFGGAVPGNGPPGEIGRTYALTCSNVLVLALDNNVNPSRVNQPWIDSVLATNTQPLVFAMGHEPAFKVYHPDGLTEYPADRDIFWRSLSNAHCRVYFSGHDHFYDHMRLDDGDADAANDVHQIIVGTGGAPLHPDNAYDGINDSWTPVRVWHEQQFGYVVVEIDGLNVSTTWWHRLDDGTYAATPEVFAYTVPVSLSLTSSGGQMALKWSAGMLQKAANVKGPYKDLPWASSPYVLTNFPESRQFFRVRLN